MADWKESKWVREPGGECTRRIADLRLTTWRAMSLDYRWRVTWLGATMRAGEGATSTLSTAKAQATRFARKILEEVRRG